MTRSFLATALLGGAAPVAALAGGLDRTGQPIDILFEAGNYAELSFARTMPSLSGEGTGRVAPWPLNPAGRIPAGTAYSGVGLDFSNLSAGVKLDITEQLSAALLFSQPFGADIEYTGDSDTTELGGTEAVADSDQLTAMLRWRFDENWSVHGGLRIDRGSGEITLSGLAYGIPQAAVPPGAPPFAGGFNGYSVELEPRIDAGWLAGVAYEIPEIALRVALTYNSPIVHDFETSEFYLGQKIGESTTEVELPRSINLDFQTGIAEDTLLFGSFRWAEWSEFRIDPELFTRASPGGLVSLQDSRTWTLGLGRRFTDTFAAQVSMSWEETDENDLISPLAPVNGFFALGLGGSYDVAENVTLSAGARYTWVGNSRPETGTPDTPRATFDNNSGLTLGVSVGYRF
ncbi:MAG: outer membrane protein transport protein [Paracoccaceae bacterium]|nr:outer membrane protein transport protein [Paracoccaceae bacterium]